MSSNAYVASDGATLMKVGKANNPNRREKQIALPMTVTIACLDEAAAHRVESQLRQFVIEQGGIRHQNMKGISEVQPRNSLRHSINN